MAAVRQQIVIDASARQVWTALTTPEGVSAWWARATQCDARDGGRLVLVDADDAAVERRGSFLSLKPTRVVEIVWDPVGKADDKGTRVVFQLGRQGGETKVHVVQSGGPLAEHGDDEAAPAQPEEPDADTPALAPILETRWKEALLRLRAHLEGGA